MSEEESFKQFFKDLRALAVSAFPKRCANCGRVYDTAEQFLTETRHIAPDRSGIKSSIDDDGSTIIEVFRNCVCGSTLMDFFSDRRDLTEAGLARRKKFGELQTYLVAQGMEHATARNELIKVLRGGSSDILKKFRPPPA
jgi:hypothetical protein